MTNEEKLQMIERLGGSGAQIQINIDGSDICFNRIVVPERSTTGGNVPATLPAELSTPKATKIQAALLEAGIVDDGFGVCDGSLSKQAIVAEEISRRLFIGEDIHWALFEQMWGVKNLRTQGKGHNKEYRTRVREVVAVATGKRKI